MKKLLILTTCLLGTLVAADVGGPDASLDKIREDRVAAHGLFSGNPALGGNFKETKGDRVAAHGSFSGTPAQPTVSLVISASQQDFDALSKMEGVTVHYCCLPPEEEAAREEMEPASTSTSFFTDQQKLLRFIGISENQAKGVAKVQVAILEASEYSALDLSRIAALSQPFPVIFLDIHCTVANLNEMLQKVKVPALKKLFNMATQRSKNLLRGAVKHQQEDETGWYLADINYHKEYTLLPGKLDRIDYFNNLIVSKKNQRIKELRDISSRRKESIVHANLVRSTFHSIAPGAESVIFHPADFEQVSQSSSARVVSISSQAWSKGFFGAAFDFNRFNVFTNTGKLVVVALGNNHEDVNNCLFSKQLFETAAKAEGYSMIIASCSSIIADGLLGDVGNYCTRDQVNYHPHYMTAPGFGLHSTQSQDLLSGCSIAAPCIAAAAAVLLGAHPELTHTKLKEILVSSGRKPAPVLRALEDMEKISCIDRVRKVFDLNVTTYEEAIKILKKHAMHEVGFTSILNDHLFRFHAFIFPDQHKYFNHLDVAASLSALEQFTALE